MAIELIDGIPKNPSFLFTPEVLARIRKSILQAEKREAESLRKKDEIKKGKKGRVK